MFLASYFLAFGSSGAVQSDDKMAEPKIFINMYCDFLTR